MNHGIYLYPHHFTSVHAKLIAWWLVLDPEDKSAENYTSSLVITQQTQNICIASVQRRSNVVDVGPTLYRCYTNVLCLLGNAKSLPRVKVKVRVRVYSLISSISSDFTFYPLVTGPVHSCAFSSPRRAYSPAAISAHWTYHTQCHLCPTRYSFSPDSSEAFLGLMLCPET